MNQGKKKFFILSTCVTASFSAMAAPAIPAAATSHSVQHVEAEVEAQTNDRNISQPSQVASSKKGKPQAIVLPPRQSHAEIVFAGGIAGTHTRDSHMQVTSIETDTLAQTNSYRYESGVAQIGAGYVFYWVDGPRISDEWRWFPTFEPMLNLYYSSLSINGNIDQFNSVFLDNLKYQTRIKSTRLLLDCVLTIVSKGGLSFHGLLGVGQGWNRVSYEDKDGSDVRLLLNSDNENNIVWEWGGGFNYAFSDRFSLSLDYIWTDLGRLHTSSKGIINIPSPEIVPADFQVTTQAVLLGVHWGFC
jgi:opacity protein-like surface antigen